MRVSLRVSRTLAAVAATTVLTTGLVACSDDEDAAGAAPILGGPARILP